MFLHSPLYEGLFRVASRSEKSFKLHIGSTIETISRDRLKPFHTQDKVIWTQPRPRGRLPKKPILSQSQSPRRSRDLGGTYVEAGIREDKSKKCSKIKKKISEQESRNQSVFIFQLEQIYPG